MKGQSSSTRNHQSNSSFIQNPTHNHTSDLNNRPISWNKGKNHRSGQLEDMAQVNPKRLIYKPSSDLVFDLEMRKRNSEHSSDQEVRFGKETDIHDDDPTNEFDDETLKKLNIPPPLKYKPGLENYLRSDSIYLYNRSIALLRTEQIINHLFKTLRNSGTQSGFDSLEWIDDFSCVITFDSTQSTIRAFHELLIRPQEVEGENGLPEALDYLSSPQTSSEIKSAASDFVLSLRPAKPFNKSLFETNSNDKQNNYKRNNTGLLKPTQPDQFIPFIRFATLRDAKKMFASDNSLFYALNGRNAGKEGVSIVRSKLLNDPQPTSKRKRPSDGSISGLDPSLTSIETDPTTGKWLHADTNDLPTLDLSQRISKQPSSSNMRSSRSRSLRGNKSNTSSALDDELDRFMSRSSKKNEFLDGAEEEDEEEEEEEEEENFRRQKKKRINSNGKRQKEDRTENGRAVGIELLSDRMLIGGGNLTDQTFQKGYRSNRPSTSDEEQEVNDEGLLRDVEEVAGSEDDEEFEEIEVEVIDEETGKKVKRITRSRRDQFNRRVPINSTSATTGPSGLTNSSESRRPGKSKNRWGPLFNRLF